MTTALARVLLVLPMALPLGWQGAPPVSPRVELRQGEATLVLTPPMHAALRAFDPDFTARHLSDYPPSMWRPGCTWSSECARALFRLTAREAPFAIIGDFNGDRIADAVIDGDNRDRGRRIVLLSTRQTFSASEIHSLSRIPHELESSRSDKGASRDWEDGLGEGLSWAKPDTYRTPYEPKPLVLTTDGFVVNYFGKAASLYYLLNGTWHTFILSD